MKKCLILHGRGGNSKSNWFPWLKRVMEKKGYEVFVPDLPNTSVPNYEEQMNFLEGLNLDLQNGDLIFGHSLGCKLAMKYIEKNKLTGLNVSLVAPVYVGLAEDMGRRVFEEAYVSISDYFNRENSFEKLGNKYSIFLSDDDPYIDMGKAKDYLKNLENTKFIDFEGMGHFTEGSGNFEFKELLEY